MAARRCGTNSALASNPRSAGFGKLFLRFELDEPWALHPRPLTFGPPQLNGSLGVGQILGSVDREEWSSLDPDVARILEALDQPADVLRIVFLAVHLLEEQLVGGALPPPVPALVGPAEREGKIRVTERAHLIEGPTQHPPSTEPVVVVEEARDPVLASEQRLSVPGLGHLEVIEPELARKVGLPVAGVQGFAAGDDAPLGETGTVPGIVLRHLVELRKIERQHVWRPGRNVPPLRRQIGHQHQSVQPVFFLKARFSLL